jgi:predicted PurR-regulated permease PerM
MNPERAAVVIILTLFFVILFNISLYLAFRGNRSSDNLIEMLQRASKRARDPWKEEDESLAELSRRVEELKESKENPKDNE